MLWPASSRSTSLLPGILPATSTAISQGTIMSSLPWIRSVGTEMPPTLSVLSQALTASICIMSPSGSSGQGSEETVLPRASIFSKRLGGRLMALTAIARHSMGARPSAHILV